MSNVVVLGKISLVDDVIISFTREDLSSYRQYINDPVCEICGRHHHRVELYIAEIDGERVVCGKRCLENAQGKEVVKLAIKQAKERTREIELARFEAKESLIGAVYQIKNFGFVASNNGDFSSSWDYKNHYYEYVEKGQRNEQFVQLAKQIELYYRMLVPSNDFEQSIHTVILNGYHSNKVLGLFPAAVNSYIVMKARQSNNELANKHNLEQTKYFGNVGDKVKQTIELELIGVRTIERAVTYSYYDNGTSLQYLLKDNEHHIFSWTTTAGIKIDQWHWLTKDHIGSKINVNSFTVKNHYESKLGHITSIIRPKFEIKQLVERKEK